MKESVRLGRIGGVTVGFNWSLLLIAAFLAIGLGSGQFPIHASGYPRLAYAAAGGVTALAFLGGVLLHEISHAMVAKREGLPVDGIVLWLMGGYTRIGADPATPGAELRISASGPLASLLLGLVSGAIAVGLHHFGMSPLLASMFGWLAYINVALAAFNLLPGSPLDGGRVLHSIVWRVTDDRSRATRAAALAGRGIGAIMVGGGSLLFISGRASFDGIWLAAIGWFLVAASRAEEQGARILEGIADLHAADLMAPFPTILSGWLTIDGALEQMGRGGVGNVFLVQQWSGHVTALVTFDSLQAVPVAHRRSVRVIDLATPLQQLPVVGPGDAATDALRRLDDRGAAWVVVVDAGHIVGLISEQMFTDAAARHDRRAPAGVG